MAINNFLYPNNTTQQETILFSTSNSFVSRLPCEKQAVHINRLNEIESWEESKTCTIELKSCTINNKEKLITIN